MSNKGKDALTLAQAASALGLSVPYVRTLAQSGKLRGRMIPVSEGSEVMRYAFEMDDIVHYLETAPRRNIRTDGRNKYFLYATPAEFKESVRVLKAAGPTTHAVAKLIVPANIRKPE